MRVSSGAEPVGSTGEIDVLVRRLRPGQTPAELELIENEQRRELSDEEEADAFIQLARDEHRTLQQLAQLSGRSVAYISKRIRVFEDPRLRQAVKLGQVAASQAEELLRLPEPMRAALVDRSVAESWTHDRMREAVRAVIDADGRRPAPTRRPQVREGLSNFRVENSRNEDVIERPPDLSRRVHELDVLLSGLQPFQLTRRDVRALAALRGTLEGLTAQS